MAANDRDAREAYAAQTLANLKPFEKVDAVGRLRAIHSELVYAIDKIVDQQRQKPKGQEARFNDAEVEVLRSIALQIIYVLDSNYRPKPGPVRRLWRDFSALSPVTKVTIICTIIVTLAAGGWTVFHDLVLTKSEAGHSQSPPAITQAPPINPAPLPPAKPPSGSPAH